MLGGCGACGGPLCCSTFLSEFSPVSIKFAKVQDVTLVPSEITGMCELEPLPKYQVPSRRLPLHASEGRPIVAGLQVRLDNPAQLPTPNCLYDDIVTLSQLLNPIRAKAIDFANLTESDSNDALSITIAFVGHCLPTF